MFASTVSIGGADQCRLMCSSPQLVLTAGIDHTDFELGIHILLDRSYSERNVNVVAFTSCKNRH